MNFTMFLKNILRPYRLHVIGLISTGVFWAVQASLAPMVLKEIINNLAENKSVLYLAFIYVSISFLNMINFRSNDLIKYRFLPRIKQDIAICMFDYIKEHSYGFFQNTFSGTLSKKIDDMVVNCEALIKTTDEIMANLFALVIAIISMSLVNKIFAITLLLWAIIFLIISHFFSKNILLLTEEQSKVYSLYSGSLVDIFSNIASVKLFARSQYEANTLKVKIKDLVQKDERTLIYTIKMRVLQDVSIVFLIGIMLYQLIKLYQEHLVSIGDFAFILTLTMSIFQMIWYSASRIVDSYRSVGRCKQALSVMNLPHNILDSPDAKKLVIKFGEICWENVCFEYENNNPIFVDFGVKIEAGTKVGLVGFSGSGKTTFVNLILRNFEVKSGAILIDGQDIKQVTQTSLRQSISMIPQDITLFHRTLLDNIGYGNIEADKEAIVSAARKAYCHDFICSLPDGYNTVVGERGVKLSGGQRQRIAIARAILEDSPILILDEATSALDSVTEQKIQASLKFAMKGRTTIVVAHRLSTLLEMDRILVFHDGKIIEDGTHFDLVSIDGHYKKMWDRQTNGFIPDSDH